MPGRGQRRPRTLPGDPTDPAGMARAIADYLDDLAVRNYSPTTIEGRTKYLGYFTTWAEERGITQPTEVSRPVLQRYQRHLFHRRKSDGNPLTFQTQLAALIAIRGLFGWLVRESRILYNPASDLDLPRIEHRLPRAVLTAAEAEVVLAQPDLTDPIGVRDRAILEVLYSTGIRRSECCRLKLFDLDFDRGTLIVRQGKGHKDRMIPVGERALAWVDRYLNDVRSALVVPPDEGFVFLTRRGDSITPATMTRFAHRYVRTANIGKRGSCHLFRHTMATLMLEGGADIRHIQEMLGHASVSSTQVYTQVSIRALKAIHTATHPGATNERHRSPVEPDHPVLGPPTAEPAVEAAQLLDALDAEAAEEDADADDED